MACRLDRILLIRTLRPSLSEILSETDLFSFKKMHLKMSSVKLRYFSRSQCFKGESNLQLFIILEDEFSVAPPDVVDQLAIRAGAVWYYSDVIMGAMAPQIIDASIVY